jgi:erythritol transport system permease protein
MSLAPTAEPAPRTAADAPPTAEGRRLRVMNLLFELRAFIALIVIVIVFGVLSDVYLSWDNLVTMTKHVAINAILAIGMLMVILTGGIDLSVGSIVGLAGVVAGVLLEGLHLGFADTIVYLPVWGVMLVAILVGTGVGAVNGALVTRFSVAPFIATLGTLYMARGVALLISGGETYPNLGGSRELGNSRSRLRSSRSPWRPAAPTTKRRRRVISPARRPPRRAEG